MQLTTADQRTALLANGAESAKRDIDPQPVVKLFTPDAGATWLLTELDPAEPDIAFGLCDLGHGSPELAYVRLSEIQAVRGRFGLPVKRDTWFVAAAPLSVYAVAARHAGRIVEPEAVALPAPVTSRSTPRTGVVSPSASRGSRTG